MKKLFAISACALGFALNGVAQDAPAPVKECKCTDCKCEKCDCGKKECTKKEGDGAKKEAPKPAEA